MPSSEPVGSDRDTLATKVCALWHATVGELTADTVLSPHESYGPRPEVAPGEHTGAQDGLCAEGQYDLAEQLGRGGMGVVFRARQRELHRDVAIKLLRPGAGTRAQGAFQAEVATMARLEHPGVVPVHASGQTPEGKPFLAMKLVDGKTWASELRDNGGDLPRQLAILQSVSHAVAFAHSRGIVHCDLKPANIMLGSFGEVLIMDWGLAVSLEPDPVLRHREEVRAPCGTPAYIAPELAEGRGSRLSPATDVYLLGAILCELLRGTPPHSGQSLIASVISALTGELPQLPAEQPSGLKAICLQALQLSPELRFPDAAEFAQALADHLRHHESASIAGRARARLKACQHGGDLSRNELYEGFTAALAGFDQAQQLWPANPEARAGLADARHSYAQAALARGDLGLAAAQADKLSDSRGAALRQSIASRQRHREAARARNRRLRWALLAALSSLVVGLLLGLWLVGRERNRAEEGRQVAQQALRKMMLGVREQLFEHGTDSSKRLAYKLLQNALRGFQTLETLDPDAEGTRAELAWAQYLIAETRLDLEGDLIGADESLDSAEQLVINGLRHRPHPLYRFLQALVLRLRSELAARQGDSSAAHAGSQQAVDILHALATTGFPEALGRAEFDRQLATSLGRLGTLLIAEGALDRAGALFEEALALTHDDAEVVRQLLQKMGHVAVLRGEAAGQRDAAELAVDICRGLLAQNPGWSREVSLIHALKLAANCWSVTEPVAAETRFSEALQRTQEIRQLQPENWQLRLVHSEVLASYAHFLFDEERFEHASALAEQSLELQQALFGRGSPRDFELLSLMAGNLVILTETGRRPVSDQLLSEMSAATSQLIHGLDGPFALVQSISLRTAYARIYKRRGDRQLAWQYFMESLQMQRALVQRYPPAQALHRLFANNLRLVAAMAAERGDDDLADGFLDEAEQILTDLQPQLPAQRSLTSALRAQLQASGRLTEARDKAGEAVALALEAFAEAPTSQESIQAMFQSHAILAQLLEESGALEQAAAVYQRVFALILPLCEENPGRTLLSDFAQFLARELQRLHQQAGHAREALVALEAGIDAVERTLQTQTDNQVLREELCMLYDLAAEQSLRCEDLARVLEYCQAVRGAIAELDERSQNARERLADLLASAAQVAFSRGESAQQRALLTEQAVHERWLVARDDHPEQRYKLAATLFNLSLLADEGTAPRPLDAALQEAWQLVADQPDSELARRIGQQRQRVRQRALLDGWQLPETADDYVLLARGLEQRGGSDRALRAWSAALALPGLEEARGPNLLAAAQCAARVGADTQALAWLAAAVADVRARVLAAESAEERASLRAVWQRIHQQDPAFEALRGQADFEALFAEQP